MIKEHSIFRFVVVVSIIFLTQTGYAVQKAITDTGEEVTLNSDGTWRYSQSSSNIESVITTNKTKYKKPDDSSFLLKSTKNNSAFWVNTIRWSFKKATNNAEAEYEFQLKG